MKIKQTLKLNAAWRGWLIFLAFANLGLVHCSKEDTGPKTISDEEIVTQAKDKLEIDYIYGDSSNGVTGDIRLPSTVVGDDGEGKVTITWASENPKVINVETRRTGMVNRPENDTGVTLTATLTKNDASDTKAFVLNVLAKPANDEAAIVQAKDRLAIIYIGDDSMNSVTTNIVLPVTGVNDVSISWASSNINRISRTGVVRRSDNTNANVTLTATIAKNAASDTKDFILTVLSRAASQPPVGGADGAAVMQAARNLEIGYAARDSASSVTRDITLPTMGVGDDGEDNGVTITWASSHGSLIDPGTGMVTRPDDMDTEVTLAATLTKNAAIDIKTFTLTVLIKPDDPALINITTVAQLIAMRYDQDGDGSVDDITNESAYQAAFPDLDGSISRMGYELKADLDLSGDDWSSYADTDISTTFEGNGHTISNVTITVTTRFRGFFANINTGGHVRNLHLEITYSGDCCMGAIAGKVQPGGTITGSSSSGTLTTTNWYAGGLVGENQGTIIASSSSVNVTGGQNETGGLVGANFGTIVASYATGNVSGAGRSAGGLVGSNEDASGRVVACYATGTVTGDRTRVNSDGRGGNGSFGGLMGRNNGGTIIASYATGNVNRTGDSSDKGSGGLLGWNEGGTVTNSYSTGTVTVTGGALIGGLVGENSGTITNSYFDSTTSGITTGDGAKTTSELQMPTEYGTGTAIFSGWNIDVDNGLTRGVDDGSMAGDTTADDLWDFGTPSQYPVLKVDFNGNGTASVAEFGSQR